jgi:phosphoribosyl 1,2-cyclic phosphodiesterase
MNTRILFLGTGGDEYVIGKQKRASGGIIFTFGNNQFHIDPGPSSLMMAKMMSVNLRENIAILLTANELFRANDVNAVISAMSHDGLDKRGVLVCPSTASIIDKENYPFLNPEYKKYLEKVITIDNTKKLGINNIDIEVIELKKSLSKICGYKIITPGFNLAYIPETGYDPAFCERIEETDILILNVKEPRGSEKKDCLNSNNAEEIIKKVKPQLAILTGFGVKMLQADPLYEVREIQKNTGVQTIAAKDGMSINPTNFSATVRQKSLKSY